MSAINVRLLGSPRIEHKDGTPIALSTRKAMAMLAYLALAGAAVSRERLMALLWPDFDQTHAQGDLRRALTTLRKALGEDALVSTRQTIALNLVLINIDGCEFRAKMKEALQLNGVARIALLEEAAALWRDDFMAGSRCETAPNLTIGRPAKRNICAMTWQKCYNTLLGCTAKVAIPSAPSRTRGVG